MDENSRAKIYNIMHNMFEFYFYCIITHFLSKTEQEFEVCYKKANVPISLKTQMNFKMKYEVMLFCLNMYEFEACIFLFVACECRLIKFDMCPRA